MSKYSDFSKFKDLHKGERCFVILTGPSLTLEDVELLKNETTFAVNSCIRLFSKTSWRPNYYVITDRLVYKSLGNDLENSDMSCPIFYSRNGLAREIKKSNSYPFKSLYFYHFLNFITNGKSTLGWSNDISKGVADAPSCVYAVMQIAYYMGFKEVYVIGADCNYSGANQHSVVTNYKPTVKISKNAGNHVLKAWRSIKIHLEDKDMKVYNSTRGGMLELFPRVELEEIINKENE
jgi:hypothetical protein